MCRQHPPTASQGIFEAGETPADAIPDTPENQKVRAFLLKAPTKGVVMPLGMEVKVMQCWRCKAFGHRTGDRDCPLFLQGNARSEAILKASYDPMHHYLKQQKSADMADARSRIELCQRLLAEEVRVLFYDVAELWAHPFGLLLSDG